MIYLATLVTASGAPAIHLRVGHSVFLPGFYLPLQLYFFFQAFKTGSWKYIFLSAATLALMVFNGGTHILPMSIASLGMFSLCAAIATARLAAARVCDRVRHCRSRLFGAEAPAGRAVRHR